jgi:hypothetical protein
MRGFRLNRWQRIGIVLSVLWVPVGLIYEIGASNDRYEAAFTPVYDVCRDKQDRHLNKGRTNNTNCAAKAGRVATEPWWIVPLTALAPIAVAWLLVYIIVWTVRWVRRGFQPST